MNVELLNRVKAHILEEPKRLFMPDILRKREPDWEYPNPDRWPSCGTLGCFAGWICALSGIDDEWEASGAKAATLAGLEGDQAHRLFFDIVETWSREDNRKLWSGDGTPETAALAAKRLDLFIESGGAI